MKIGIELSSAEVKGIKAYLASTGDANDRDAIRSFVSGIVHGTIHAPQECVSDYIKEQESK